MIYDTNDIRILSAGLTLESEAAETATVRIECQAGYYLSGTAVADCTVEARPLGGGAWTDIESSSIDLTPYAGAFQDFEIRFTAPVITSRKRRLFSLIVDLNG